MQMIKDDKREDVFRQRLFLKFNKEQYIIISSLWGLNIYLYAFFKIPS